MASSALTARQRHQLNRELLRELEPGDLIEFPRGLFSHWAVFIGDEEVVHLAGDDNDGIDGQMDSGLFFGSVSGQLSGKAWVKKESYWTVVGESVAVKNNKKDQRFEPLSKREIVQNALGRLGRIGYNVLFENCEHFASWCRYGECRSDQADFAITAAAVGVAFGVAFVAALPLVKKRKSKE